MKYFTPIGIAIIMLGLYPLDSIWMPMVFRSLQLDLVNIVIVSIVGGLVMFATWGRIVSLFVCGECNKIFLSEYQLRVHYSVHIKKDHDKEND